jgi:hypothetical protein
MHRGGGDYNKNKNVNNESSKKSTIYLFVMVRTYRRLVVF